MIAIATVVITLACLCNCPHPPFIRHYVTEQIISQAVQLINHLNHQHYQKHNVLNMQLEQRQQYPVYNCPS